MSLRDDLEELLRRVSLADLRQTLDALDVDRGGRAPFVPWNQAKPDTNGVIEWNNDPAPHAAKPFVNRSHTVAIGNHFNPVVAYKAENDALRRLLFALMADPEQSVSLGGELRDNSDPAIDYARDSVAEIERKLRDRYAAEDPERRARAKVMLYPFRYGVRT